jgi:methyl coenzyme M reductase subunit C
LLSWNGRNVAVAGNQDGSSRPPAPLPESGLKPPAITGNHVCNPASEIMFAIRQDGNHVCNPASEIMFAIRQDGNHVCHPASEIMFAIRQDGNQQKRPSVCGDGDK